MRVADYLMKRLADHNITHVFQVTGRGSLFLNDALAKNENLKGISLHHEQSCSFAALAYSEKTGNHGACLLSTGCASTNAITGLLCAWQDAIPCIFISGQNTLKETTSFTGLPIRTYGQQEADIVRLIRPITKYAMMVTNAEEAVLAIEKAFSESMKGRKGPVWLDIPLNIQSSVVNPSTLEFPNREKSKSPALSNLELNFLKEAFLTSKRPVILIGSGVRNASALLNMRKFIEKYSLPLTFSSSAVDIYGTKNNLSIGSVGSMGCSRAGNFAVQNSDLLLILGSRLSSLTTGVDFCSFAREAKIIVVDIDKVEHQKKGIKIDKFIESDVSNVLSELINLDLNINFKKWSEKCIRWKSLFSEIEPQFKNNKNIDLYELSKCLSDTLPSKTTLITDSGLAEVILPTNISFADDIRCIHSVSQGSMGFALPASIGVSYASKSLVVAVIGDGSIMMNLQELESISYQNIPIKIIVINNNVYSIIRRRQTDLFRKRTIGTDPSNGVSCPDFRQVAECFKIKYMSIKEESLLELSLKNLFKMSGPVICEIFGKHDQSYIEVSSTRSLTTRRYIRRPLEDQYPFLDRDLFLKEMIVKPIAQ